jgi:hypothetical protein
MMTKQKGDIFQINNLISRSVANAHTFDEIREGVMRVLRLASHMTPVGRVGYLSGIITSLGHERIGEMTERLEQLTGDIRENVEILSFPVFSSSDIFPPSGVMEARIKASGEALSQDNFNNFWDLILRSGFVTDMFMTPGWPVSSGAKLEHEIAERMRMIIHFYELIHVDPGEMEGSHVAPVPPHDEIIIWNKSVDSIRQLYQPRQTMPFYAEHEAEMVGDFQLLRGLGGAATEITGRINRNIKFGRLKVLASAQRREANQEVLVEYNDSDGAMLF